MRNYLAILTFPLMFLFAGCASDNEESLTAGEYIEMDYLQLTEHTWYYKGRVGDYGVDCHWGFGKVYYYDENKEKMIYDYASEFVYLDSKLTGLDSRKSGAIVFDVNRTTVNVKIIRYQHLVAEAIVRYMDTDEENKYILHVDFKGKTYEIIGYIKD